METQSRSENARVSKNFESTVKTAQKMFQKTALRDFYQNSKVQSSYATTNNIVKQNIAFPPKKSDFRQRNWTAYECNNSNVFFGEKHATQNMEKTPAKSVTAALFSNCRQQNADILSIFFALMSDPGQPDRFECFMWRSKFNRTKQVIQAQPDQVWLHWCKVFKCTDSHLWEKLKKKYFPW